MAATATESKQYTGCVKWFNNPSNYGFITVLTPDCEYTGTDIFVHQSNIKTSRDCYRTLYTNECVQFNLAKSDNEKHPYQAVNVSGYNGMMLHCENQAARRNNNYRGGGGRGRSNRGRQSSRGSAPHQEASS